MYRAHRPKESQMMCIPKRLETLMANFGMLPAERWRWKSIRKDPSAKDAREINAKTDREKRKTNWPQSCRSTPWWEAWYGRWMDPVRYTWYQLQFECELVFVPPQSCWHNARWCERWTSSHPNQEVKKYKKVHLESSLSTGETHRLKIKLE